MFPQISRRVEKELLNDIDKLHKKSKKKGKRLAYAPDRRSPIAVDINDNLKTLMRGAPSVFSPSGPTTAVIMPSSGPITTTIPPSGISTPLKKSYSAGKLPTIGSVGSTVPPSGASTPPVGKKAKLATTTRPLTPIKSRATTTTPAKIDDELADIEAAELAAEEIAEMAKEEKAARIAKYKGKLQRVASTNKFATPTDARAASESKRKYMAKLEELGVKVETKAKPTNEQKRVAIESEIAEINNRLNATKKLAEKKDELNTLKLDESTPKETITKLEDEIAALTGSGFSAPNKRTDDRKRLEKLELALQHIKKEKKGVDSLDLAEAIKKDKNLKVVEQLQKENEALEKETAEVKAERLREERIEESIAPIYSDMRYINNYHLYDLKINRRWTLGQLAKNIHDEIPKELGAGIRAGVVREKAITYFPPTADDPSEFIIFKPSAIDRNNKELRAYIAKALKKRGAIK